MRVCLVLLALLSHYPPELWAREESPQPAIAELELISSFKVPRVSPENAVARDIRWASDDSIHIAFDRAGVLEFRVGDDLVQELELFPPRTREGAKSVKNLWNLATSDNYVLAWSFSRDAAWRGRSSDAEIHLKSSDGLFEDIDVSGDRVALLGHPGLDEFSKSGWAFLWIGDLRSGLAQWRPIRELSLESSDHARVTFSRLLGSLRFLHNGDLLVVPVVRQGVFQFAQSGKLRRSWTPRQLERSLLEASGVATQDEGDHTEALPPATIAARDLNEINSDLDARRLILEDVLPVGKRAGVIVRLRSGKTGAFYLGVLSDDIAWYKLPLEEYPATVRIRADSLARKRRLVVLATARGALSEAIKPQIYLIDAP